MTLVSSLDQPVRGFLDQLAARTPTPGGGGAAAVTGAMAAGLVAMAARFSARQLPGAGDLADQADELRRRAADLADLDARRLHGRARRPSARARERREALLGAALVPLEIAGDRRAGGASWPSGWPRRATRTCAATP